MLLDREYALLKVIFILNVHVGMRRAEKTGHKAVDIFQIPKAEWIRDAFRIGDNWDPLRTPMPVGQIPKKGNTADPTHHNNFYYNLATYLVRVPSHHPFAGGYKGIHQMVDITESAKGCTQSKDDMTTPRNHGILTTAASKADLHQRCKCVGVVAACRGGIKHLDDHLKQIDGCSRRLQPRPPISDHCLPSLTLELTSWSTVSDPCLPSITPELTSWSTLSDPNVQVTLHLHILLPMITSRM